MQHYLRLIGSRSRFLGAAVLAAAAIGISACGASTAPSPSPSPTAQPTPAATPTPTAQPTPGAPAGSVIVTFGVVAEQYRILLTDPEDIEVARALLAGEEAPSIPNGLIVRGDTGVNTGYSWHIDPDSVEFADMTIELCDGIPSFVEDGTLEGDRFCPWAAEVVEIAPAD